MMSAFGTPWHDGISDTLLHYSRSHIFPAPETHTRYRVQRLIRMGEWLERNEAALQLAIDRRSSPRFAD